MRDDSLRRSAMRTWKKPIIVERACGCEVSAYADAEI
jgi:coenzyme PQQ precursor peptide PqqA